MKTFPVALLFCVLAAGVLSAAEAPAGSAAAEASLARLLAGNQRYTGNAALHLAQDSARRESVAKAQHPFAIVLGCADSRVPPEILFDQGLGELFVIRNAGNVVDDDVLGSMEYAVEHLHVPLIVVMGHSKCGAVAATVAGGEAPGHIHAIVEAIEPSARAADGQPGDKVDNTVRGNALLMARRVVESQPILAEAVKAGKLQVVAARYDLESGAVSILR